MSEAFMGFAVVLAGLTLLAAGVGVGYHLKEVYSELRAIRAKLASLDEDGGMPEIAIVDAKSPKQVREEAFEEPDEESAIVVAKKPSDLRKERDRKLTEELDKLGR